MNICLIYPTLRNWEPWPPLGLAYIASFIEKDFHNVRLIDRNVLLRDNNGNFKKIDFHTISTLKDFSPKIVGITATTPLIVDAYRVAKLVKENLPTSMTILGGTHATVLAKEVLEECPYLDLVCIGEGEITFKELVSANKDLSQTGSLAYRKDGKVIINNPSPPIENLDDLPFPARHLIDMAKYTEKTNAIIRGVNIRATHIFSSRGCLYKCRFCAGSAVFGKKVRFHSPQYILSEVKHLIDKYNIDGLYFAEDMFLSSKRRVEELCRIFIEENLNEKIKWGAQLKADVIDEVLLRELKKAGCIQVEYGFESGSDRVLNLMAKKTTVSINYKAAELTRKNNTRFLANIIVGTPEETMRDFSETINFIRNIDADYVAFNKFIPLPGSYFYNVLREKGLLTKNWESYWTTSLDYNFTDIPRRLLILKYLYHRIIIDFRNMLNYYRYNLKKGEISFLEEITKLFKRPGIFLRRPFYLCKRIIFSIIKD